MGESLHVGQSGSGSIRRDLGGHGVRESMVLSGYSDET
jgi:hypothetical protein